MREPKIIQIMPLLNDPDRRLDPDIVGLALMDDGHIRPIQMSWNQNGSLVIDTPDLLCRSLLDAINKSFERAKEVEYVKDAMSRWTDKTQIIKSVISQGKSYGMVAKEANVPLMLSSILDIDEKEANCIWEGKRAITPEECYAICERLHLATVELHYMITDELPF